MSVTDLHPEDLLDREARGDLAPKERAMLDAHLAHCAACRLEREVRADFADEMATDSPVHDGSLLLVSRVLEKTEPPPPEAPPEPVREPEVAPLPPLRISARPRLQLRVAVLVAAALMLASVAGARATGVWAILSNEPASDHPAEETTRPLDTAAAKTTAHATPRDVPAPIVAVSAPEPIATATANAPMVAAAVPAPEPRPVVAPAPILATTARMPTVTAPTPITTAMALTPEPPPAEDPSGAPALFARANSARRQGEHTRAAALYRDLLDRHPDAAEASATRVALGRLLLDDGDAAGALPLFETYLRSGDPSLREEAMVGRARAHGRLGREADERAAWSALLQGYPQSIHAARAHARLEELGHR